MQELAHPEYQFVCIHFKKNVGRVQMHPEM